MAEEAQHGTIPVATEFLASLEALPIEGKGEGNFTDSLFLTAAPQLHGSMFLLSPMTSRSSILEVLGRARNNHVMSILICYPSTSFTLHILFHLGFRWHTGLFQDVSVCSLTGSYELHKVGLLKKNTDCIFSCVSEYTENAHVAGSTHFMIVFTQFYYSSYRFNC